MVAIVLAMVMFILVAPEVNDGDAMSPTINDGQILVVSKTSYSQNRGIPERDQLVILEKNATNAQKVSDDNIIARVAGLPGETVEIKDGKVYIDGSETALDDSFIPEKMQGSFGPYTVPDNCYFMLGDNRNDSKDSRFWKNTFVRFDQIVGKAVVRYYPSIKLLGYEEP